MKKLTKPKIKAIYILVIVVCIYITGLMACICVCTRVYSNIDEEQYIEIGHQQGRRQILDSLKTTSYGTEKFSQRPKMFE